MYIKRFGAHEEATSILAFLRNMTPNSSTIVLGEEKEIVLEDNRGTSLHLPDYGGQD